MVAPQRSLPGSKREARALLTGVLLLAGGLALLAAGCGSSDNGPVSPNGINITLESFRVQVTRTVQVEAVNTYPYARNDRPPCDWYVDGILGGNAMRGTITQANPATFTAPPAVPQGGTAIITAVSRSDTTFTASDTLTIAFTVRYVDGENGTDTSSGGTWTNPLRTLTYALDAVADGDTVYVLPGSYDPDHGETGSFFIPGGVALIGASRESCSIWGSGSDVSVVRLGDGATLENVTVGNWNADGMAVHSTGGGRIRLVTLRHPFEYCGIRADGGRSRDGNDVIIEGCELVNVDGEEHEGTALELFYGTHCTVRECTVAGWQFGLHINRDSDPLVEGCSITDNQYGVVAAGTGAPGTGPDLGGGARGSAGGNAIRDNLDVGVQNITIGDIWALNNEWTNDPPTEGPPIPADFVNVAGGTVIWSR
jgi:hypothetical protein